MYMYLYCLHVSTLTHLIFVYTVSFCYIQNVLATISGLPVAVRCVQKTVTECLEKMKATVVVEMGL